MSRREWEHGEFTLPAAEFAQFRQAIQAADKAHKDKVFAHTQQFWKGLSRRQQSNPDAYRAALREWAAAQTPRRGNLDDAEPDDVAGARFRLEGKVGWGNGRKPSRVLQSEMEFPTNRTTTFRSGEATITFEPARRGVVWDVPENNHAIDGARESHLGTVFFDRLDRVRWTHGTGGSIVGNDEYSQDSDSIGGGANYCTGAYGYLGIVQAPERVGAFTNAKGQRVDVDVRLGRFGWTGKPTVVGGTQGRVRRGVPAGGQFAGRQRGEADVQL